MTYKAGERRQGVLVERGLGLPLFLGLPLAAGSPWLVAAFLVDKAFREAMNSAGPSAAAIEPARSTVLMVIACFSVLSVLCVLLVGLYVSHRVSGPLHRLRTYLNLKIAGNAKAGQLHFRDGDLFDDIPELIERVVHPMEHPKASGDPV